MFFFHLFLFCWHFYSRNSCPSFVGNSISLFYYLPTHMEITFQALGAILLWSRTSRTDLGFHLSCCFKPDILPAFCAVSSTSSDHSLMFFIVLFMMVMMIMTFCFAPVLSLFPLNSLFCLFWSISHFKSFNIWNVALYSWLQCVYVYYLSLVNQSKQNPTPQSFLGIFNLSCQCCRNWQTQKELRAFHHSGCRFQDKYPDLNCGILILSDPQV